jgi:dienelactone hydrolase
MRLGELLGSDRDRTAAFLARTGVPASTVDSFLASPLYATASTRREAGPFPLVLIAHGNGQDAVDQAVFSEYLASQGLVVVSTPSPMRQAPMQREDQVAEFAERQASDLADAMDLVSTLMPVDTMRVAIVGHSFGARAALLLAMRAPRVAAIVSLDGGIGTATATESFRNAPSFHAEATVPPLLHFHEALDEFMRPDFSLLQSLRHTSLVLEPTRGMRHVHFTTFGFAAAYFPEFGRVTRATPETRAGVVAVAERSAAFLREHLRAARERDGSR